MERNAGSPAVPDLRGQKVVAGLFTEWEDAVAAINDLKAVGFSPKDVRVAMRNRTQQGKLAEETGTTAGGSAGRGTSMRSSSSAWQWPQPVPRRPPS